MDSPSWKDVFHSAFGSCLHCFKAPSSIDDSDSDSFQRPPRYLESLLTEPLLDTDTEAETVSLHSNVGQNQSRRKKKLQKKHITFFGYDLFGRRSTGPIHLPEDDEEDGDEIPRRSRRQRQRPARTSSSTISFDGNISDAAPLDSAAINERVIEEEEVRAAKEREKEERKRKRRERKEMKRFAAALAQTGGEGEFEGFQGSGTSYAHIPSPFQQEFLPSSPSVSSDYFGPFQQATASAVDGDEDDAADLDGGLYAARKPNEGGSSVSGGGSDSRRSPGGTSASRSDYSDSRPSSLASEFQPPKPKTKKPKKSSSSSSSSKTKSAKSRSSASATSSEQTESLVSPASPNSLMSPASSFGMIPPSGAEDKPAVDFQRSGFPMPGFGTYSDSARYFPSPGLGFNGVPRNGVARGGAFLASRD
ncbi:hypothetical protein EV360DRAFT_79216 [Lentinula raphanica]|nr:hypothetical protein EV360DRAFT_79216 [Lentinula raphanica]